MAEAGGNSYPDLDVEADTSLRELNFDQIRHDRFDRNKHFLEAMNARAAAKVFPSSEIEESSKKHLHPEEYSALMIQRYWRGFKGRQIYVNKLFEKYQQEEQQQHEKVLRQMEEGNLLVENHELEVLLEDGRTVRRNAKRLYIFKVIKIQRAWKAYRARLQKQNRNNSNCTENTNYKNRTVYTEKGPKLEVSNHDEANETAELKTDVETFFNENFQGIEQDAVENGNTLIKDSRRKEQFTSDVTPELSPSQKRKRYFLSQAQEFVELKKTNSNVLPFNLHLHFNPDDSCDTKGKSLSMQMMSDMSPQQIAGANNSHLKTSEHEEFKLFNGKVDKKADYYVNTNICDNSKGSNPSLTLLNTHGENACLTVCDDNNEDAFDVYNIETALPDVDWKVLEEKLKAASEEAKLIKEARRNDREEIRKKLAMGGDDDSLDDNDDDDEVKLKRPSLQSRLHSGLQICFMNESPVDTDNEGASPRQHVPHDNDKLVSKVNGLVDSDNNLSSVTDLNNPSPPTTSIQSHSPPRLKADDKKADDFHSRQEQLQNEAKLALAQAGTMAHMQLEIEKQTQKKSPIAEMAGIPGLGERRRKKLSVRQLQQMNLAQTQVLYNDLQTQIESLNEDLVRLLMERDELHMEQDSMLVDIEDLTRRAEELADRANRDGKTKTCKMPSR